MTRHKLIWTITRILTFIIVGLFNKLLIRPEDIETWKNYGGYAFLVAPVFDTIYLSIQMKKEKK